MSATNHIKTSVERLCDAAKALERHVKSTQRKIQDWTVMDAHIETDNIKFVVAYNDEEGRLRYNTFAVRNDGAVRKTS